MTEASYLASIAFISRRAPSAARARLVRLSARQRAVVAGGGDDDVVRAGAERSTDPAGGSIASGGRHSTTAARGGFVAARDGATWRWGLGDSERVGAGRTDARRGTISQRLLSVCASLVCITSGIRSDFSSHHHLQSPLLLVVNRLQYQYYVQLESVLNLSIIYSYMETTMSENLENYHHFFHR